MNRMFYVFEITFVILDFTFSFSSLVTELRVKQRDMVMVFSDLTHTIS